MVTTPPKQYDGQKKALRLWLFFLAAGVEQGFVVFGMVRWLSPFFEGTAALPDAMQEGTEKSHSGSTPLFPHS